MNQKEVLVNDLDIVFFDCEMTGLTMAHELIEIGYVKVKARTFEIIAEGDIKILPVRINQADPAALEIVQYDPVEWKKEGVSLKQGLETFLEQTKDAMLAGHCVTTDVFFLKKSLAEVGLAENFFYKMIDTFPIAWSALRATGGFTRFSLDELSAHFNIDRGRAHRAIDDARTTYQVFKKLISL